MPYFKAGLERNKFCIWVTSGPLKVKEAKAALEKAVKDLDTYIKNGQIKILEARQWHKKSGKFEADKVLEGWVKKENQALHRGFDGLCLAVNTFELDKRGWRNFTDYEALLNNTNSNHRMLTICSYSLDKCTASEIIDVVSNHHFALIKREGKWDLIESSDGKLAEREHQKNYEKLIRIFVETVNALACAVETRDPYTYGHQKRVTELACAIAEEMGLQEAQIDGLRMAGIIHDIGKIQVPAEILSKPGLLTEIELDLIKTHPQVGYDILKTIEFPYPVAQIILQHHERMDCSGYPSGLRGNEILLEARILAVADVVEAMASHRPYRPALGIDKALKEIMQNKDFLYDPEVVDTCLKVFSKNKFKLE